MKYALNLADDGRVLSATYAEYAPTSVQVGELPDGDVFEYRFVGGVFIHDPLPTPEVDPEPTDKERIADLEEALAMLLSGVTE